MDALDSFVADLRRIFGDRLQSVVVYDAIALAPVSTGTLEPIHALTLVPCFTTLHDLTKVVANRPR